ncbi:MAG: dihydroxyacetone kinase phosphoryl donor subunit DhaM [Brotaphodocola sp.]
MVGLVIVSHSENLAKSVIELTSMMAPTAKIAAAGGLEDGSFGTSFERIQSAIEEVYSDDGVLILMDLGSAVMTTEMVIEMMDDRKIAMADCPLVEGAVVASINTVIGKSFEEIQEDLKHVWDMRKTQ